MLLGRLGQVSQPQLETRTGWDTCPASLAPLLHSSTRKKPSGTEVRRTLNVKLRFVGFIRFLGFSFGQIQKIKFVIVMVWSYSFGHLDSVK